MFLDRQKWHQPVPVFQVLRVFINQKWCFNVHFLCFWSDRSDISRCLCFRCCVSSSTRSDVLMCTFCVSGQTEVTSARACVSGAACLHQPEVRWGRGRGGQGPQGRSAGQAAVESPGYRGDHSQVTVETIPRLPWRPWRLAAGTECRLDPEMLFLQCD